MKKDAQARLAGDFRRRHQRKPLMLLANAWDPISAAIVEAAGYEAVATTSGGVAWALGYRDGEETPWREVVDATARIARVVRVPVTADIEAGYGDTSVQVAQSVRDIIAAGAVGVNIEDGTHDAANPMRGIEESAARIRAAREVAQQEGVPIVIDARIDLYLKRVGTEETRLAETIARGKAYLAAGADCLYPFALADLGVVAKLVHALGAPINLVGRPGTPPVADMEAAGVTRVTVASGLTLAAMGETQRMAEELRKTGRFDVLASAMTRDNAQHLFAPRPE
jgi:2-methylisocitrate lyase-like PEP mutase family enzyme